MNSELISGRLNQIHIDMAALVTFCNLHDWQQGVIVVLQKTAIFAVLGRPVPYFRMTQGTKDSKEARRYLDYQDTIAGVLNSSRDFQKAYIKARANNPKLKLCVSGFTIPENGIHGDFDNYLKGVTDAIQRAQYVENDKQIKAGAWMVMPPDKIKTGTYGVLTILNEEQDPPMDKRRKKA